MKPAKYQVEAFREFVENIGAGEKILVIYHPDPDGVSSAALLLRFLKKRVKDVVLSTLNQGEKVAITPETIRKAELDGYSRIITLDLNVESDVSTLKLLASKCNEMLVIDHHVSTGELKKKDGNITYISAYHVDEKFASSYPAAKLLYDLISYLDKTIKKFAWISAIGIYGDCAETVWKEFMDDVLEEFKIKMEDVRKAANLIEFCRAKSYELVDKTLHILTSCDTLNQFLQSEITREVEDVEREFTKIMNDAEREARKLENEELIILNASSPYNLKSLVANHFSKVMFPDRTIVVIWVGASSYHLSFRRQDKKVNMCLLARNIVKRVGSGKGGGHVPAAGATIPINAVELEELKKIIKEEYEKLAHV